MSKSHEETLAHLTYAISQGDGFVEVTGEVGTGKTTLCRVFLENLDKSIHAAYIFNPKLDALQLLKAINDEFGIDSEPDNTKDLIDRLNAFLIEKKSAGQKALVLIDEAQNLSLEVLEQLRLLSNLETTQEKLLQIILVGQPELRDMLASHQLRQLGQRITINSQLSPLTYVETKDYIRHRITLASHRAGPPFAKASYNAIYEYSQGIPRLINIACDRALLNAFSRNSFNISGSITKEALRELRGKKTGLLSGLFQRAAGVVIISAIFIPVILLLLFIANGEAPKIPAISKLLSPERVTQAEPQRDIPVEGQIVELSAPSEMPVALQAEAPGALQENSLPESHAAESGNNIETLTAHVNNSGSPLATGTPNAEQKVPNSMDKQKFGAYLQKLNSRFSRNISIEGILKLWLPTTEIKINQDKIIADQLFFEEEAKLYDLELKSIATESDLALIQALNLPAIFTFYLAGHTWPKYLAAAYIDTEKVYFFADAQSQTVSVDRDIFLQYWSGEAYIVWKNFKNLNWVISQGSRGQDVLTLKKLLLRLGYSSVIITDSYDNDTVQLIKDIQAKHSLHVDGIVGTFTKIALYNESSEFIKPSLVRFAEAKTENGS
ncbi:MAG TPA: AAA family ATPase [Desulfobulbales bacterium]|nr:AAA family ATPase [Desulfobulbales bacterium]